MVRFGGWNQSCENDAPPFWKQVGFIHDDNSNQLLQLTNKHMDTIFDGDYCSDLMSRFNERQSEEQVFCRGVGGSSQRRPEAAAGAQIPEFLVPPHDSMKSWEGERQRTFNRVSSGCGGVNINLLSAFVVELS